MKTALRKMGNSEGVIIPKRILSEIGIRAPDQLDVSVKEGMIVLAPTRRHPRAGWAEASQRIAAAGDGGLVWPEFANKGDEDLEW